MHAGLRKAAWRPPQPLLPDFSMGLLNYWQSNAPKQRLHSDCRFESSMHNKVQTQKLCLEV